MKFFDYCNTVTDDRELDEYRGINNYRIVYERDSDVVAYKIKPTQQFRPDKICSELYNEPELTWVIDDLNNFKHGLKEYETDRTIFVFKRETLIRNGIISR